MRNEIRKFSISFSKYLAKLEQNKQSNLENRIKILEQNLKNEEDFNAYNLCKLEIGNIYDKKSEGAKIRSKCEWYQRREKPTKFFLSFEKEKAINTTVRHLINDAKDITDLKAAFTFIYILIAYILLVNKVIYKWPYLYIKA